MSKTYTFTAKKAAVAFARAHGGPIEVSIESPRRGCWVVTITDK